MTGHDRPSAPVAVWVLAGAIVVGLVYLIVREGVEVVHFLQQGLAATFVIGSYYAAEYVEVKRPRAAGKPSRPSAPPPHRPLRPSTSSAPHAGVGCYLARRSFSPNTRSHAASTSARSSTTVAVGWAPWSVASRAASLPSSTS